MLYPSEPPRDVRVWRSETKRQAGTWGPPAASDARQTLDMHIMLQGKGLTVCSRSTSGVLSMLDLQVARRVVASLSHLPELPVHKVSWRMKPMHLGKPNSIDHQYQRAANVLRRLILTYEQASNKNSSSTRTNVLLSDRVEV